MAVSTAANEVLHLTVSVPKDVAEHIRSQVSSGAYANESEYVESMLVAEGLFEAVKLDPGIVNESTRRYEAMVADPSQCMTHEEFWAAMEEEEPDGKRR